MGDGVVIAVHNVNIVEVGDDFVGGTNKNDLLEENRLLKERLYKINAEKCYWERSAKRMRTMIHWTTGIIAGQEIEDDEEKKEFRKKLNCTEVVPPDCEHWERVPLKKFFEKAHTYFGFLKDCDKF